MESTAGSADFPFASTRPLCWLGTPGGTRLGEEKIIFFDRRDFCTVVIRAAGRVAEARCDARSLLGAKVVTPLVLGAEVGQKAGRHARRERRAGAPALPCTQPTPLATLAPWGARPTPPRVTVAPGVGAAAVARSPGSADDASDAAVSAPPASGTVRPKADMSSIFAASHSAVAALERCAWRKGESGRGGRGARKSWCEGGR